MDRPARLAPPLAVALALLAPAGAAAHVRLVSPASRYGDEMKFGPCGRPGGARTDRVTTFAPGETITVTFDEIIDHPGHYRIAFDPAGDDDLAPPTWDGADWLAPAGVLVLADRIPDAAAGPTHGEVQVTLPATPCDACTLQLIQVMTDKPPFDGGDDFYYQCADVALVAGAPPGGTPPPPAPPPPALASPSTGGCAQGAAAWPALAAALVALGWLAPGRRRRAEGAGPGRRGR